MSEPIQFSVKRERRSVVQIVTIARFRKPANPRNCNIHRYHVWSWETLENDPSHQPIDAMKCQCGCLTWTYRPDRVGGEGELGTGTPRSE